MAVYGYNRVSTKEQHLDRGVINIEKFCKENGYELKKIYQDIRSGRDFNRERYIVMKEDVLRPGDILIVPEADRIGRNKQEMMDEFLYYKKNDIRVMILNLPHTLMDFKAMAGSDEIAKGFLDIINNLLLDVFSWLAESELTTKKKRQIEGIEAMKKRGEWHKYGRPRKVSIEKFAEEYKRVEKGEIKDTHLARELGLSNNTYFKYKRELKKGSS